MTKTSSSTPRAAKRPPSRDLLTQYVLTYESTMSQWIKI